MFLLSGQGGDGAMGARRIIPGVGKLKGLEDGSFPAGFGPG